MPRLNKGDRVEVSFKGEIEEVRADGHLGIRHVVRSDSGSAHMLFDLGTEDFTILEPARDANWPPQSGDVWRTRTGETYFARSGSSGAVRFYSSQIGGGDWGQSYMTEKNPDIRLVFRNFV